MNDKCILKCSAINRFNDIDINKGFLPKDIVKKLEKEDIKSGLKRCSYCGAIWVQNHKYPDGKVIGIEDFNSHIMDWWI